jgi:hypothetical protein
LPCCGTADECFSFLFEQTQVEMVGLGDYDGPDGVRHLCLRVALPEFVYVSLEASTTAKTFASSS